MSHFTVLVVGEDPEEQLQPFHEFECTGQNDEYVQEIDKTEEAREMYEKEKERLLRSPDGQLHNYYDDIFYRQKAEKPKHPFDENKEHFIPEGYEEVECLYSERHTLLDFIGYYYGEKEPVPFGQEPDIEGEHKYGYALLDKDGNVVKYVRRTNPNRKWDWFQIGGRWTGYFIIKEGGRGALGKPGVFDNKPHHDADQARKGDIDFASMRFVAANEAGDEFDKFMAVLDGRDFPTPWAEVRDKMFPGDIDAARNYYNNQEVVKAVNTANPSMVPWDEDMNTYYCNGNREAFVDKKVKRCISTFAVLKDGIWYERGDMGWFGMVSNEKDQGAWEEEFGKLLDSLPDDTLLTVVDCHI